MFTSLEAEQQAAMRLSRLVEDVLTLWPNGTTDDDMSFGEGIREMGTRYVDLLECGRDGVPYNEWLIEPENPPYWRVVVRTCIKDGPPHTLFMSFVGFPHFLPFLMTDCETDSDNLVLTPDQLAK